MNGVVAAVEAARHVLAGLVIVAGLVGFGAALAAQLRFPDFFTRLHAVALMPLAGGAILAGLALEAWDARIALRLGLLGALLVVLGPARTHILASGAHGAGLAPLVGRLAGTASSPGKGAS